jgi:hypothetical protein
MQLLLWKMVHFALFLVKISINFSPSYSTVFFSSQWTSLLYINFQTLVQCFNEWKIAYSMRVVHSTVGTLVHWLHYIPIKAWSCTILSGVVYWLSGLCSVFQCYSCICNWITNLVEFITNTIHIIWGKQAIGLLINCKQMRIQQYV